MCCSGVLWVCAACVVGSAGIPQALLDQASQLEENNDDLQFAATAAVVPLVVHKIYINDPLSNSLPQLSPIVQRAVGSFTHLNPGYTLRQWSGAQIEALLKSDSDQRWLNAYLRIRPYAWRSDFARAYILWKQGGWYSDMRNQLLLPFSRLLPANLQWYSACANAHQGWPMMNGLLASAPGHPWMKRYLDYMVESVNTDRFKPYPTSATGPAALTAVLGGNWPPKQGLQSANCLQCSPSPRWVIGKFGNRGHMPGKETFSVGGQDLVLSKVELVGQGDGWEVYGGNNYKELWRQGNVFCKQSCSQANRKP